jgi:hypothetical protein
MKALNSIGIAIVIILAISFHSCKKKEEPVPASNTPRPGSVSGSMVFKGTNYVCIGGSGNIDGPCGLSSNQFYIVGFPPGGNPYPSISFNICGAKPTVTTTYTCDNDHYIAISESSSLYWFANDGSTFTVTVNGGTLVATTNDPMTFHDNTQTNTIVASSTLTAY